MKRSGKTLLIIIPLVLLACLVVLVVRRSRLDEPDELDGASISEIYRSPSFEVRVVMPRSGLPLGGILPDALVKKLDGTPSELRFDHASSGAQMVSVEPNRVELKADDWDFLIETDAEGRITPMTRLVFPLALGGRHVKLNCGPGDLANGYLRTTMRAGSEELVGRFVVELAKCRNAESGKNIDWPPAPLTVRGSFMGLARRQQTPSTSPQSRSE